jgi:hypothetical protein
MIYVHTFTAIEQQLCRLLSAEFQLVQADNSQLQQTHLQRLQRFEQHHTLIYSFQDFAFYKHLDSFQQEVDKVKLLLAHAKQTGCEKLILISYPGAYASSDNLFLQHKGLIEQLFVGSGIPCSILRIQGICSPTWQINNFHDLFFETKAQRYVIPKGSGNVVYSVNIKNLAVIIAKLVHEMKPETFDVFDKISSLKHFLHYNSQQIAVQQSPLLYLYVQSYLGRYVAPTMIELLMRPAVPMYNFRTEKAFSISLHAEMFEQLRHKRQHLGADDYIFSNKSRLIPVS